MDPADLLSSQPNDLKRHAVVLEYDFLKHLTTLGLAAIGAVITLAGSIFADVTARDDLWFSAGLFLFGVVAAFSAQERIVRDAKRGLTSGRFVAWSRTLAVATIGIGAGVVLNFSFEALR